MARISVETTLISVKLALIGVEPPVSLPHISTPQKPLHELGNSGADPFWEAAGVLADVVVELEAEDVVHAVWPAVEVHQGPY